MSVGTARLALTRLMSGLLFGTGARDPLTAGVGVLLALDSLVACYIPARRAMRWSWRSGCNLAAGSRYVERHGRAGDRSARQAAGHFQQVSAGKS